MPIVTFNVQVTPDGVRHFCHLEVSQINGDANWAGPLVGKAPATLSRLKKAKLLKGSPIGGYHITDLLMASATEFEKAEKVKARKAAK